MTKQRKVNHNSEIFETFKQVRISIPLLDAIKQVPSYAKFLKDLCTVKRKLNVKKKAFLAEQVSAILQNNNALKYKDPGCPTISCFIAEHKIKRALLDLGASVNLLPYSVFQSLNLGELKPTSVTLLLADRSVKVPRGIIEDVLVQVDKFIYPVDFIILDTQPFSFMFHSKGVSLYSCFTLNVAFIDVILTSSCPLSLITPFFNSLLN